MDTLPELDKVGGSLGSASGWVIALVLVIRELWAAIRGSGKDRAERERTSAQAWSEYSEKLEQRVDELSERVDLLEKERAADQDAHARERAGWFREREELKAAIVNRDRRISELELRISLLEGRSE